MDRDSIKKKIFEFLNNNELGVISTIHSHKNAPESAVVGFGNNDSLELIFGTSGNSRKYRNIQQNFNISFVIGWSSETGTIQYEGIAKELTQKEAQEYIPLLVKKNLDNASYINKPDQRYFLVKPVWIRFYDNAGNPPEIHEITF